MQPQDLPPYLMHQFWSTDPWIVYQSSERLTEPDLLPPVPCIRIIRHARAVETPEIVRLLRECREFRPNDIVLYAAQCDAHFELLRRMKLSCVRWNHNALIDERIFDYRECETTCFTSISRVVPFKRLELAREVSPLKVIGSIEDPNYLATIKPWMPHATFLNENGHWLPEEEVAMMLNGSAAMLLTSDDRVEGNCRAVTEAMLTGCPVIYTAPQRMCTTWLTPETSLAVEPEVEAINRACRTYQRWSRPEIRRLTMQRVGRYRWDLQETVEKAAKQLGYSDFHLNVQALVDARYVRWQDREQWLAALPSIIRQQLDR